MKTIPNLVLAVLSSAFFLLVSCDPAKEFQTELKSIDSCLVELDSIDQLYQGIEFDSLVYMVSHINENEEKIKKYYVSDTIDNNLGMYMNNCKGVRKSLKDLKGTQTKFAEEIAALDTQFTNLKTDILNGVFDKEEVNLYLTSEMESLELFSLKFYSFYANQKMQSIIFYSASPKVDEYVEKLVIPESDAMPL
jgi:hypothetical protein